MTKAQQTYKKSLIQKIQIAKHNVFIDDEQRKEFMLSRFGVDSTTKLSIDELKLFLDFCNRNVSDIPMLKRDTKEVCKITFAQKEKIGVVWQEKARDKSEEALMKFACKIAKYKASRIDDFKLSEAQKIIVALERMK
ncbi:regulatory protein GemA [Aliarcobacter butzleri]|uniref:phage protein GemA/Gp16 family protein n=1 Tax=Aliarcobacter butzleri TaxID=28197 RepID=UPI001EDA3A2A|nr:phage protein GemA/Gp16 family protein [Aliarcobacter butzleri]MCG3665458.1 regulatory protein GemA [Aliarcobacter butzleri]